MILCGFINEPGEEANGECDVKSGSVGEVAYVTQRRYVQLFVFW